MPPDLEAVRLLTDVVRVVDHPRRQPQHLALQLRQRPERGLILLHGLRRWAVARRRSALVSEGVGVRSRHVQNL